MLLGQNCSHLSTGCLIFGRLVRTRPVSRGTAGACNHRQIKTSIKYFNFLFYLFDSFRECLTNIKTVMLSFVTT